MKKNHSSRPYSKIAPKAEKFASASSPKKDSREIEGAVFTGEIAIDEAASTSGLIASLEKVVDDETSVRFFYNEDELVELSQTYPEAKKALDALRETKKKIAADPSYAKTLRDVTYPGAGGGKLPIPDIQKPWLIRAAKPPAI